MNVKTVAVIGSGVSGLLAIKTCKEVGLDVVCFEQIDNVGGLWRYRDADSNEMASVAWSTIINTSKEMSAFSDFPPPKDFPNYMHHSMMLRYFELYAEHFGLVPHIRFRHKVVKVDKVPDFEQTGRWKLTLRDLTKNESREEIFDAVMVCIGHHVYPNVPKFPGLDRFKGQVLHTHSYKKPVGLENKTVVVIGVGNSGGDAATELGTIAKKVYLSTRRGCWIMNRLGSNGKPFDGQIFNRYNNVLFNLLPYNLVCSYLEKNVNQRFDHELYNLKPSHRISSQHPMINDDLPNRILSGRVAVKSNVANFFENGVFFEGEDDREYPIDAVVLATGYKIIFPFLDPSVTVTENNQVELFKYVFPVNVSPPTLALIGVVQTVGAIMPASEIQCRWAAEIWTGKTTLPSKSAMMENIRSKREAMSKRYYAGERHTIQVDWIKYMDEIASLIGARPNLMSMLVCDPKLFVTCLFGPCLPYQFRLTGPHPWKGAREAILTAEERIQAPFTTRRNHKQSLYDSGSKFQTAMITGLVLVLLPILATYLM